MTREEAINEICDMANALQIMYKSKQGQALQMAIRALKNEQTGWDLITEIDKLPRIKVGNSNSPTVKFCIDEVLLYDLLERYKAEKTSSSPMERALSSRSSLTRLSTTSSRDGMAARISDSTSSPG